MTTETQETINPDVVDTPEGEQPTEGTGSEVPGQEAPAEGEKETPSEEKQSFWQRLHVQGVDNDEKAMEWAIKARGGILQVLQERADLARQVKELTKKPPQETPKEGKATWDDIIKKHSKVGPDGQTQVDINAALNERLDGHKKEVLAEFNTEGQRKTAISQVFGEIDYLAKSKLIPDWIPSKVDGEGFVTTPGSEFYEQTDRMLESWFEKAPALKEIPEASYYAMLATLGIRGIKDKRGVMDKKLGRQAKVAGGGITPIEEGGRVDDLPESEIDKRIDALSRKYGSE